MIFKEKGYIPEYLAIIFKTHKIHKDDIDENHKQEESFNYFIINIIDNERIAVSKDYENKIIYANYYYLY